MFINSSEPIRNGRVVVGKRHGYSVLDRGTINNDLADSTRLDDTNYYRQVTTIISGTASGSGNSFIPLTGTFSPLDYSPVLYIEPDLNILSGNAYLRFRLNSSSPYSLSPINGYSGNYLNDIANLGTGGGLYSEYGGTPIIESDPYRNFAIDFTPQGTNNKRGLRGFSRSVMNNVHNGNPFTMGAFIQIQGLNRHHSIFSTSPSFDSDGHGCEFRVSSQNRVRLEIFYSGVGFIAYQTNTNHVPVSTGWYFVAARSSGAGYPVEIYGQYPTGTLTNYNVTSTLSSGYPGDAKNYLSIGIAPANGQPENSNISVNWSGIGDSLFMYNRYLTDAELLNIMRYKV